MHMRLTYFLFLLPLLSGAQTLAVTEYGDTIYVYDNGRWAYEPDETLLEDASQLTYLDRELDIDSTNTVAYTVPAGADKEMTSRFGFLSVRYRDSLWQCVPPAQLNEDAEFVLKSRTTDMYSLVIVEEIEMTSEAILKTALHNMESYAKEAPTIRRLERRQVNGTEVLMAEYGIHTNGLAMTFVAYFYSSARGTVQFMVWTADNLYERHAEEIEALLNGLVIAS